MTAGHGLTLAEELALLAYDDESGRQVGGMFVPYGLGGALLAELALLRRIELSDDRVAVTDRSPTGDALLDGALHRIAGHPGRRASRWVDLLRRGVEHTVLDRLVEAGHLPRGESTALLVRPRPTYPPAPGPAQRGPRPRLAAPRGTRGC